MIKPVPGIYVSEQQYVLNSLQIRTDCIAAFAGITEWGPLNRPVLIQSFDIFLKTFGGFDTVGVLPFSIYSYFKCGGTACYVVRVANTDEAKKAVLSLKTTSGSVILEAASEGKWANYLTCRVWHEPESIGHIENIDYQQGLWFETIGTDMDIKKGDCIKLMFSGKEIYRTVANICNSRIYLTEPIKLLKTTKPATEKIKVEKIYISFVFTCKKRTETYLHLSMNPDSQRYFVSHINKRSSLLSVISYDGGIIHSVFLQQAAGGNDGIADIKAKNFIGFYNGPEEHTGIGCFESKDDISLVAVPDATWLLYSAGKSTEQKIQELFTVQNTLINQAERFPGRFAILDVPTGLKTLEACEWAKKIDTAHAAAYYPEIDIIDPLDSSGAKTVRVPPSGAVCGCIAATDGKKGVFYAPANMMINGAVGVAERINDGEYEFLYNQGINLLKYFPGRGIKVWGARTLSSNPDWKYINVRRTFSRIAESIKIGTRWAIFEPNDKNLRKRLVRQVSGFLLDLWMKGYLAGSTSEQAFFVRCDEELNPIENIDAGIVIFEVGIAIVKPVEFFTIKITAEKDGASVYIDGE